MEKEIFKSSWTEVTIREEGDKLLHLRIAGLLDEKISFSEVLRLLEPRREQGVRLLINIGGVQRANSSGLREWFFFLEKATQLVKLEFSLVNEVMILQADMISNVLGPPGTAVHEFEVPYYCKSCALRMNRLVRTTEMLRNGSVQAPPRQPCPTCKNPMQLDALQDDYFTFLHHAAGKRDG